MLDRDAVAVIQKLIHVAIHKLKLHDCCISDLEMGTPTLICTSLSCPKLQIKGQGIGTTGMHNATIITLQW